MSDHGDDAGSRCARGITLATAGPLMTATAEKSKNRGDPKVAQWLCHPILSNALVVSAKGKL
jgi:hypothetical protein